MELLTIEDIPTDDWTIAPWGGDHEGFCSRWWQDRTGMMTDDRYTCHRVLDGRVEVARFELDWGSEVDHYALDFANLPLLEIELIEVRDGFRRHGVASRLLEMLGTRHADKRLFALSEGADEFWRSRGWARYEHPAEPDMWRPLFLAPSVGHALPAVS